MKGRTETLIKRLAKGKDRGGENLRLATKSLLGGHVDISEKTYRLLRLMGEIN